ncbi:hypothetical protein ABT301_29250 [Streptomyces sp. NPDC000987]|uniref:hypothetical protein n=1 Tax=Streptomyces sp. NPDC000987 TaxID=3154374 RepID=UPI003317AEE4
MTDRPQLPARPRVDDTPQPRNGVRVEYRATVPHRLMGAALAEAFAVILEETQQQDPPALD